MVTKERQIMSPCSERRLAEAREGDIVKISLEDDRTEFKLIWTLFKGNRDGVDYFMAQEMARTPERQHLVIIHKAPRKTHDYFRNTGVMISARDYTYEYVGKLTEEERYNELVDELKEADLWSES